MRLVLYRLRIMVVQGTLTPLVVVRFYQPVPIKYGSVSGIGNAAGCKPVAFEHCWFKSNLAHHMETTEWLVR